MSGRLDLSWTPPGPVSAAFMASRRRVQVVNGPVGSGKTTTAIMKAVRLAAAQKPSLRTTVVLKRGSEPAPVRLFRLCVVRDTFRQLWRTTLPSWFKRFPRTLGSFTGADNAPATHLIDFALADGTVARMQADFIAIGDQSVEDVLRGYEPTAFYLNELDLLSADVFAYAATRTGRYPDMAEGGPSWHGIIADCNAPVIDSWLYEQFFLATPDELAAADIALFRQPGGRAPGAENLANLPGGAAYYEQMARTMPAWMVRRMVDNLPGFNRNGKPVYGEEWNDLVHVAAGDLDGIAALPLIVGMDAGGSPAAAFAQRLPSGRWRVLDEMVTEAGTGATRFGDMLAQRLRERFRDWPDIRGVCDPSALYGADRTQGDKDWSEIVAARAGIRVVPAPTNKPTARWEAVRVPLSRMIDGQPAFQLSPRCRTLRAGFNAGYRFRAIVGTNGRFSEEAEKSRESHVHDALQYAMSWGGEDVEIRARRGVDLARMRTALPAAAPEWTPYSTAAGA